MSTDNTIVQESRNDETIRLIRSVFHNLANLYHIAKGYAPLFYIRKNDVCHNTYKKIERKSNLIDTNEKLFLRVVFPPFERVNREEYKDCEKFISNGKEYNYVRLRNLSGYEVNLKSKCVDGITIYDTGGNNTNGGISFSDWSLYLKNKSNKVDTIDGVSYEKLPRTVVQGVQKYGDIVLTSNNKAKKYGTKISITPILCSRVSNKSLTQNNGSESDKELPKEK